MENANVKAKKQLLSINEAAEVFGIGRQTLRALIKSDESIPKIEVGTHVRIHSKLFEDWLEKAVLEGRSL